MSKIIFSIAMSVDGYVAGVNRTREAGLGEGGEALHEWAMGGDEANRRFLEQSTATLGAIIVGRRTYDDSILWWGADGPTGEQRLPVFVITHKAPAESPENGVYRFETGGVPGAIAAARKVAGDKDVALGGGPTVLRQAIELGVLDEIAVSIAPVLFGDGLKLVEALGRHVRLEQAEVTDTRLATHIRYRVVK